MYFQRAKHAFFFRLSCCVLFNGCINNHVYLCFSLCNAVTLLVGHRTCDSQVAGSSLGWASPCSDLGQALIHSCASVTKQYNLVPTKGQWCSSVEKVTAGLADSNGRLPPGLCLTYTGWLPRGQDQLRAQRSLSSMRLFTSLTSSWGGLSLNTHNFIISSKTCRTLRLILLTHSFRYISSSKSHD